MVCFQPKFSILETFNSFRGVPFGFELSNAIAFGDNPSGNDGPLGQFSLCGSARRVCDNTGTMPFFSVAASLEDTPLEHRDLFVGGLEKGTAVVLDVLVKAAEEAVESSRTLPAARAATPTARDGAARAPAAAATARRPRQG